MMNTTVKTALRLFTLLPLVLSAAPLFPGNPLAGLPSQPGSTVAAINALGDNTWLNLGTPAADSGHGMADGVAGGCSWGGHSMVFIPELRGAFRTGEGQHAYVKPDGYGGDDYWFYDINRNRPLDNINDSNRPLDTINDCSPGAFRHLLNLSLFD